MHASWLTEANSVLFAQTAYSFNSEQSQKKSGLDSKTTFWA